MVSRLHESDCPWVWILSLDTKHMHATPGLQRQDVHRGEGSARVCDTPLLAPDWPILPGMNADEQQAEFMSWKIAPARLNATQAAWYLGFEQHEIAMLVGEGLLKPLGHPARNAAKFFATQTLDQLRRDEKWLARATDAIADYWRQQNARKRGACGRGGVTRGKALRRVAPAAERAAALPTTPAPVGTE
jgi:hypothetical protein